MILFPKKPLIKYIELYESENMCFNYEHFDRFVPNNRNYLQFSVLFSISLKETNCAQNFELSVFTKDFMKNYNSQLYGKILKIETYTNWIEIKTYIENIVNSRIYGSCDDLKQQLVIFFNLTNAQSLRF